MRGYLFDDYTVEIDPRSVAWGGSWQGAPRDGLPAAWDGDLLKFFYERLPDAAHFLDVGASTGSYCLLAALRPDVSCAAFEPYPAIREVLEANVALNGLGGRVAVFETALWHQDGVATLQLPGDREAGLACLADTPTRFAPTGSQSVEARRLDGLDLGPIDVIKIDVEGAELSVLQGAVATLARDHPALLLEYDERNTAAFGYERDRIVWLLEALNYTQFEQLGPDGRDLWAQ